MRIATTLRSVLLSVPSFVAACALAVFFAARSSESEGLPSFVHEHMGPDGAAIAFLMLVGFLAATWCSQWVGNILAVATVGAAVGVVATVVIAVGALGIVIFPGLESLLAELDTRFAPIIESRPFEVIALLTSILLGALACTFLFRFAHRRGLLKLNYVYIALAALPFLVAGLSMMFDWDRFHRGRPDDFAQLINFAFFAISPLATVPLVMHYTRHR